MKLSIVTINYNNKNGLIRTIDSVFSQQWFDFEYIIIDGGSTDGSSKAIEEISNRLSYWQSQADKGIYNAMNIGLDKANGEYLLFLNSGDCLTENALSKVFLSEPTEDIIYGDIIYESEVAAIEFPDALDLKYFLYESIGHNATFIKRKLFEKIGRYDERYKIVSDWLFFLLSIVKYEASHKHIPEVITTYSDYGVSRDSFDLIKKEKLDAICKYFPTMSSVFLRYIELNNKFNFFQQRKVYKIYHYLRSKIHSVKMSLQ